LSAPALLARWNPWRGLAGLPGRMWLLFAASLINRAGTMVLPFLVLYLTRSLGFSPGRAGAMLALYGVTAIASSPIAGRLADRCGPLPVMVGSLFAAGAVLVAYPLAHGVAAVALATIAFAAGNEMYRPASLAAVGSWLPPAQLRMGFVLIRLAINLGMSVGPAVGGLLIAGSIHALFLTDAVTSLAAGTLLLAALPRLRRLAPSSRPPADAAAGEDVAAAAEAAEAELATGAVPLPVVAGAPGSVLSDRTFLGFLLANTIVFAVFFQHLSALPLFMVRNLGLSPAVYGLMFTINTLLIVLLEVPLNAAMADWPLARSLSLGSLVTALGFGGIGLTHEVWGVLSMTIVFTFGEMILFPSASSYASQHAPAGRRGAYMGAFSMTGAIAFATGPWAGTAVLARWGPAVLWGACFVAAGLAAVMLARLAEPPATGDAGS
jgi:MFS family permease